MDKPSGFYVSVIDGQRWSLLAGPCPTHKKALEMVDTVRKKAVEVDAKAWFYAFGTCLTPPGYDRPRILNDLLEGA